MAFPSTQQLDIFPTAGALSASWSSPFTADVNTLSVLTVGNVGTATSPASAGWKSTFGPDQEAWITLSTAGDCGVKVRVSTLAAGGVSQYFLNITISTWDIRRQIAGAASTSLATATQAIANGDSIGLRAEGSVLTAFYRPSGGSWAPLFAVSDTGITSGGYAGMRTNSTTTRISAFGAGSLPVPTPRLPQSLGPIAGPTFFAAQGHPPQPGKNLTVLLNATLSFSGAQTKNIGKGLSATLSFSGGMAKSIGKSLAAALSFSGGMAKSIGKSMAASLSFAGGMTKSITKNLAATLGLVGAISRFRPGQPTQPTLAVIGPQVTLAKVTPLVSTPVVTNYFSRTLVVSYGTASVITANVTAARVTAQTSSVRVTGYATSVSITPYNTAANLYI